MTAHTDPALTDQIERLHLQLEEEDAEYHCLGNALSNEEAVEGSFACDDMAAALLLRDYAKRQENTDIAHAKLATIVRALHIVRKRYGLRRGDNHG